jgi:hypothetical protein
LWLSITRRPAISAVVSSRRSSAAVGVIGFSQITSAPARRQSDASSTWLWGGVSTWTTSGSAWRSMAARSVKLASAPNEPAA